jgi:prephenate dehydrogenase
MWRDIALANREALLAEIDGYSEALAAARSLVSEGDGDALVDMFEQASTARRAWEAGRVKPVPEDKG